MSESDISQLIQLLENGLNADEKIRTSSENIMLQGATNNPSDMVNLLLDILKSTPLLN
jgi:hypothetical protein